MQTKVLATGVITNPDTPQAELVLEIAIDCPSCGPGTIRIPGHHLRVVRDIAIQYCDSHPELTKADIRRVNTQQFDLRGPTRPEDN